MVEVPLHHPNHLDGEPLKENGLMCFLDCTRGCSAECMAFESEPPEGHDYVGKQWANCIILTNLHKGGKHLVVLASLGDKFLQKAKTEMQDRQRQGQIPPPVVK